MKRTRKQLLSISLILSLLLSLLAGCGTVGSHLPAESLGETVETGDPTETIGATSGEVTTGEATTKESLTAGSMTEESTTGAPTTETTSGEVTTEEPITEEPTTEGKSMPYDEVLDEYFAKREALYTATEKPEFDPERWQYIQDWKEMLGG